MTYGEIIRSIQKYLGMTTADQQYMISQFINESIREFCRIRVWKDLITLMTITLNDSGTYDLVALATAASSGEYLYDIEITDYNKQGLAHYKRDDVDNTYAIQGKTLYIDGDEVDLTFIYLSPGTTFPLTSSDTDEEPAVLYFYPDVIEKMVHIKMLEFIGDDEKSRIERVVLQEKLAGLIRIENTVSNHNKKKIIKR